MNESSKAWAMKSQKVYAVCLVGSTKPKWKKRYRFVEETLTLAGYVVLTVVWFRGELPNFEQHRPLLEKIHFKKIRMSDAVVLISRLAKGKHTQLEIAFAQQIGKPVITWSKPVGSLYWLKEELKKQ